MSLCYLCPLIEEWLLIKRLYFKYVIILFGLIILNFSFYSTDVFAEEYTVNIPFGAFNPELNTPTEIWYDPPEIFVNVGDTITWINDDREGHTVTSGQGSGRFGFMNPDEGLGKPDGFFDSDRFMPGESWSYTFEKQGEFSYFCVIHPWMAGIVLVQESIPDYPHDAFGNKIEKFPIVQITPDRTVEINFSWDPPVIKTHEKVNFIYRFYDGVNDLPLRKMQYDIRIIHNGEEVYRDEDTVSSAGGAYRQWIFEEPGSVIIKISNIQSFGTVAETVVNLAGDSPARAGEFSTIVYANPEKTQTTEKIIQPKETFQFYYEIAVLIIIVPAILLGVVILFMKRKKPVFASGRKATPI